MSGSNSWSQNRTRKISEIAGRDFFQPRRLGVFYIELSNSKYCFVAIERTRRESFRTAIYQVSCEKDFVSRLAKITSELEKCKGVWKNIEDAHMPNKGLITHKGDFEMIAQQITAKLAYVSEDKEPS